MPFEDTTATFDSCHLQLRFPLSTSLQIHILHVLVLQKLFEIMMLRVIYQIICRNALL
jgi:hypothetical protein